MCPQELAHRLGVRDIRFKNTREIHPLDLSSPSIVRDPNKCILCGDCVRACEELQGIGALGFAFRGTEAMVMPAFNKKIAETQCVNCGQCRVFCPTGAITFVEREAAAYDEEAVLANQRKKAGENKSAHHMSGGCPGSRMRQMKRETTAPTENKNGISAAAVAGAD